MREESKFMAHVGNVGKGYEVEVRHISRTLCQQWRLCHDGEKVYCWMGAPMTGNWVECGIVVEGVAWQDDPIFNNDRECCGPTVSENVEALFFKKALEVIENTCQCHASHIATRALQSTGSKP